MLNRLFIVIGLLAILVLGAAFVLPHFIPWGDYRERMEAIGGEVLGAPVTIVGDLEFALLPQPQLQFSDVRVGSAEAPVMTVARVEAQFSLTDFLRDRYAVTRLVLEQPQMHLAVAADGSLNGGLALPEQVSTANVSVADAEVVDGAIEITDRRSGQIVALNEIEGDLRLDALRGPFSFQGRFELGGEQYDTRLTTGVMEAGGATQLSVLLRRPDLGVSLNATGELRAAGAPTFSGDVTYRQVARSPAAADVADAGRGDLVLTGRVTATPDRVLLSDYTLVPDENRAASRLGGAAEILLRGEPTFNAVVSGGVVALAPRDATAEKAVTPYEVLRLLEDLPEPPVAPLPGRVGVDVTEVDLRAVTLRDVRLDATVGTEGWRIERLDAELAGGTRLHVSGDYTAAAGRPNFAGTLELSTSRLDRLGSLWRQPPQGNPLFNLPARLQTRVSLVGETLSLTRGVLTIDGTEHAIGAEIGFEGSRRHLNLQVGLGAMDAADSAALLALLPEAESDPRFAVSFPQGEFDVTADSAVVAGLEGAEMVARGSWEGGVLVLDDLRAADLGGIAFDARVTAFGTLARPEASGSATITVAEAEAPGLARLYELLETPASIQELLAPSLPAALELTLSAPSGDGSQNLTVGGRAGAAALELEAELGAGFFRALQGPLRVGLELHSDDPARLTAQLGLGPDSLVPETASMHAVAVIEGTLANSFEATLRLDGGGDTLGFSGNVVLAEAEAVSGNGTLKAALSEPAVLLERLGVSGLFLPALEGSARLEFSGADQVVLEEIEAEVQSQPVSGHLALTRTGDIGTVTGNLQLGRLEAPGFLRVLAGPAALLRSGDAIWPSGPIDLGPAGRSVTGRVAVQAPEVVLGGDIAVNEAAFQLDWNERQVGIREFSGTVAGGQVGAEFTLCCTGDLVDKRLRGRLHLKDVPVDAIAPPAIGQALDGSIDATAQVDGTGDSVVAMVSALTGEGTYSVAGFRSEGLDAGAFDGLGGLEAVLELEPETLASMIVARLEAGAFTADDLEGGFTIAGGVIRSPNIGVDGEAARLFGDAIVDLADLQLSGGFVMSPIGAEDADTLVSQINPQIIAQLSGTLLAPARDFDVTGMVDGIMVRALEIEVARLERLRAEDEARRRAAAEERARLITEDRERRAAEEEAQRRAEEQTAAERAAAEQAAAEESARDAEAAAEAEAAAPAGEQQATPENLPLSNEPLNLQWPGAL